MNNKMHYLYRFLNSSNDVLYIGRTNDIHRRILKEHFTDKTHLPEQCYLDIDRIEYVEITHESEAVAYEAMLINRLRPKYNSQFNDGGEFDLILPEFNWQPFQWAFGDQIEVLKAVHKKNLSLEDALYTEVLVDLNPPFSKRIITGYEHIDRMVHLAPASVMMIAGTSDSYKTNYALNIALNNAKRGKSVLYINLKNDTLELTQRLLSMEGNIDVLNIYNNKMTENDWQKFSLATNALCQMQIFFDNHSVCNPNMQSIEKIASQSACDLIIIDDFNTIEFDGSPSERDRITNVAKALKRLAITLQTPVISIYNLANKKTHPWYDPRPTLEDLEHNVLLSYTDIVQLLYKDDEYMEDLHFLEVITSKNNLGALGTAKLACIRTSISNYEKSPSP